jgi:hypothetical protein
MLLDASLAKTLTDVIAAVLRHKVTIASTPDEAILDRVMAVLYVVAFE